MKCITYGGKTLATLIVFVIAIMIFAINMKVGAVSMGVAGLAAFGFGIWWLISMFSKCDKYVLSPQIAQVNRKPWFKK